MHLERWEAYRTRAEMSYSRNIALHGTVLRKLNPRCGGCAGGVPLSPNSLHKAQAAQWPAVVFSRGPDKKKRQREDFNTAQLKRLVEVYDMHETERPDRSRPVHPPAVRARRCPPT